MVYVHFYLIVIFYNDLCVLCELGETEKAEICGDEKNDKSERPEIVSIFFYCKARNLYVQFQVVDIVNVVGRFANCKQLWSGRPETV